MMFRCCMKVCTFENLKICLLFCGYHICWRICVIQFILLVTVFRGLGEEAGFAKCIFFYSNLYINCYCIQI